MQSNGTPDGTDPKSILIERLAVSITHRLRVLLRCEEGVGSKDDCYVYHLHTRDFEIACEVLWKLGVSDGAFSNDEGPVGFSYTDFVADLAGVRLKGFPPYYLLKSDIEIERLLKSSSLSKAPTMDLIIEGYLRIATNHGIKTRDRLPTPRNRWFTLTHSNQSALMRAFVLNGYAKQRCGRYLWTDKMAPVMSRIWVLR